MTASTTSVMGLLPLVLFPGAGSELYRGLGSVVVGGLLDLHRLHAASSSPPLFSLMLETKAFLAGLFRSEPPHEPAAAEPPRVPAEVG